MALWKPWEVVLATSPAHVGTHVDRDRHLIGREAGGLHVEIGKHTNGRLSIGSTVRATSRTTRCSRGRLSRPAPRRAQWRSWSRRPPTRARTPTSDRANRNDTSEACAGRTPPAPAPA